MYIPEYFRMEDEDELHNFIRQNSFAILVTIAEGKPLASHIPVELEKDENGKFILRGHVAKNNPQSISIAEAKSALMIFQSAHSYVSSGWYAHLNVPTWNYTAVHVYGALRKMKDEELYNSLVQIVNRYETNEENPVKVEKMPIDFVSQMLKGVTGFELNIESIQGNFKLSQNRNAEDYKNIISHLEQSGESNSMKVADEMKKRKPDK